MGFQRSSSGKILFRGVNMVGKEPYQIAQMCIALVPQGRRIFPSLTVAENLTLGWRKRGVGQLSYNLDTVFDLFPALKARSRHKGNRLSGGEQQMVAIGRALMTNPELLLMDEPFEGLAPAVVKEITRKIMQIKVSGVSILLVEQNIPVALQLADYVYIMNRGKIVYEADRKQLQNQEEIKKHFLL